jgi:hypothetical protein
MAPVDINCCKFDYDGEYLAILHQAVDKHRLKIWDVNTNVIKVEFADDQISKFTCMNWGLLRVAVCPPPPFHVLQTRHNKILVE